MRGRGEITLRGALTALVTPFDEQGRIDVPALERLVRWQVDAGIDGLVPCGTTGEGATLRAEEHTQVIETVVRIAAGRVPVTASDAASTASLITPITSSASAKLISASSCMNSYCRSARRSSSRRQRAIW